MIKFFYLWIGCLFAVYPVTGFSQTVFPAEDWAEEPDPIASPLAEPGGKMRIYASQYPKSFNYYMDNNVTSSTLFSKMYETLLTTHSVTLDWEPNLAENVVISDDRKTFTFHLDPNVRWSDGEALTAEDVRWTFDMIMDPKNLTGPHKVPFQRINRPEIIDEHTVRFTADVIHWRNLLALSTFQILPAHVFQEKDMNRVAFEFPVVSGLYRIKSVKEGFSVVMEKREDYWNADSVRGEGVGNFDELEFRFYPERDQAFEAFKKGDIDLFAVYTAHRWAEQTQSEAFQKNWIIKQVVENHKPLGFQGFAMNLRRPLFQDVKVRQALAHLLDRERMNSTLMHNAYRLSRSYFEDLYGPENENPAERIDFNKDKARELLSEAGWVANPETGLLEKDGEAFILHFLTRSASSEKFLVIYKEDLLDVGIQLEIVKKDWAAWSQDMQEYNFDMTWAAWGASVWKDPESMWHSDEVDRPSGNNITGFSDPEVDALIEKLPPMFDVEARHAIVREIDQKLAAQVPYILLWNTPSIRMLYWNKFGTPETVLGKYGNENSAQGYWWLDEFAVADLEEAMEKDLALPAPPDVVRFDEVFNP